MPTDAARSGPDHYQTTFLIDEDQHRPLTRHTRTLLHRPSRQIPGQGATPH
ncbi:hypothetical protein [Streptomyces sp. NPDC056191]|uniref:hypothetical protein n=1 Tax=Streptomyces sp. NPDC056191 TaxID=3345742 RepID=UPI0035D9F53A